MAQLRFESYTPGALSRMSERELRREYSRLRSVAKKSLERLKAGGFEKTTAYKLNVNRYVTLANVRNKKDLVNRLSDLSRFVSSRAHTVSGMKAIQAERIETLQGSGYTWVNKTNIAEFGNFMNYLKQLFPKHPSADPQTASTLFSGYRALRRQGLDPEQMQAMFTEWVQKNTPDSYLLRPAFTDIPAGLRVKTPWD